MEERSPVHCSCDELLSSARAFLGWIDRVGLASYDPYDVWGTRYGLWSRRVYYRRGMLGVPLIAPLVALDILAPGIRRLIVKKQRFATADGQMLMALLNLHAITGDAPLLERARRLGDEILAYAVPGYRGPCWGYPFDWEHGRGAVWRRNTPYITCTPYCYEAFLRLHEVTGEPRYLDILRGIAAFVHGDLRDTVTSPTAAAGSYSPIDNSQVVNASAYRAWLLIDAGRRFERPDYSATGIGNLNFVLESQREDGSWLYAMNAGKSFIDNFHTCFNLKNLQKISRMLPRDDVSTAITRGFAYYHDHLLHPNGDPKSFSKEPRFQIATLEMYNFAEGITTGVLLAPRIPEAAHVAEQLAARLIRDYQLAAGHFVTRVFRFGLRHTFPFLRWPQAQLFYAVTNLLRFKAQSSAPTCVVPSVSSVS